LRALKGHEGPIDEETGARILALYGVARPAERTVSTPRDAADAARTIGFPVVVKAQAPEIPHKAKLGGVRLGLRNATDVEVAAAEVLEAATRGGARAPKVLVQRMARGAEVLVGAVVDDRFGPMITVRPGGALAEEGTAVFVPCPLTSSQARVYLAEQASHCGLDPDRHDLRATARAVEAISRIAHDLRGRLTSFEANPLLVSERGAVAVDALAEVRPE
jgi:succinyl-CoA synthetase beta subunit